MSQFEREEPSPEEPDAKGTDQKEPDPEILIDEEFEKKQKRENAIIKTVLDGIFTFFQ